MNGRSKPPAYLPEPVWDYAKEIKNDPVRSGDLDTLERLLADTVDATRIWMDLDRLGVRDRLSWGLLLDFLLGSAPGAVFQPKLRTTLRQTRELQAQIATKADELMRLLDIYLNLNQAKEAGISCPMEFQDVQTLLETAGWRLPLVLKPWEVADLERSFRRIELTDLLAQLVTSAKEHDPTPMYPHQAHAMAGYDVLVRQWVWSTDVRFRLYVAPQISPSGLRIGSDTLACIGRVILAPYLGPDDDISVDAIAKARTAAPDPLPSDYVLFFGPTA